MIPTLSGTWFAPSLRVGANDGTAGETTMNDHPGLRRKRVHRYELLVTVLAVGGIALLLLPLSGGFSFYGLLPLAAIAALGLIQYVIWGRDQTEQAPRARRMATGRGEAGEEA
jgi:hypothetical protein